MVILVLLVVLLVLAMLLVTRLHQPAEADSVLNIKAENAEQRVAFLSQFGWSFDEDPVEVAEVIIPPEFDEVYEKYNAIQKEQGFDLTKYQGKRVKRWTYAIKNYPGYAADSGCILRILPVEVISMRRVRNFTQKERSAVIQVFTLASIR